MYEKLFAVDLFDDKKMKRALPRKIYAKIRCGTPLTTDETNLFAKKLLKWALERGADRYALWFQPLNGIAAEKQENFFCLNGHQSASIKFGAKQLTVGEGDASSFPHGGMRETFEARGVAKWDETSYCFVKDGCLYVPSSFASPYGDALDKRTPLRKSCFALDHAVRRVLRLLGIADEKTVPLVGAEQEYFLIDEKTYYQRLDLAATGRTLVGKAQVTDYHYYGALKDDVCNYMQEVNRQLIKLGIVAKTQHNEVAPCQYELAPCYAAASLACDQNLIITDVLKRTAERHGFVCVLAEKPFAGVNGSGKHNNWSVATESGKNLLEKGDDVTSNALFLLMIAAVIQAVDERRDLLLYSTFSAGNELRMGGNEAPPKTISVFLGDNLLSVFEKIASGSFVIGKDDLKNVATEASDRNRTSPVAFCQNKFEFRAVGSSANIADVNTVINTAVAQSLTEFADRLEKADDLFAEINALIASVMEKHGKIIYNGDNYSASWQEEAEKRNLTLPQSVKEISRAITKPQHVKTFVEKGVFCEKELHALKQVFLEDYCKKVLTENTVLRKICRGCALPSAENFASKLLALREGKSRIGASCDYESKQLERISLLVQKLDELVEDAERREVAARQEKNAESKADACQEIRKVGAKIAEIVNEIESLCPKNNWAMPTLEDIFCSKR